MQILLTHNGASVDDGLRRLGEQHDQPIEIIDCQVAMSEVRRRCPDVLLIDGAGDDFTGQRTLKDIRTFHPELPIVVLSDAHQASTAAAYLNTGADDFVRKPVDLEELSARIGAVHRRANRARRSGGTINAGPVMIDDRCKRVTIFGDEVALSPKEYQLLQLCASEPGKVFSHEEITECLWPQRDDGDGVDIKQYVHLLRSKMGKVQGGRDLIENVKGFGYRLLVSGATGDRSEHVATEDRPWVVGEN